MKLLQTAAREGRAISLRLIGYAGMLALLAVGAVTLWEQLPDAVAQARVVAITAGWTIEPPPLRGSL